jgi:hypothetical protein
MRLEHAIRSAKQEKSHIKKEDRKENQNTVLLNTKHRRLKDKKEQQKNSTHWDAIAVLVCLESSGTGKSMKSTPTAGSGFELFS